MFYQKADSVLWLGLLLLVAAILLYGLTLDNGLRPGELEGGDLITHQYAQVQARPSNAPGYPLYTIGGWLWFHSLRGLFHLLGVATPNPIPLLSSYSTLWALIALGLLYRILCFITRSPTQPRGDGWLAGVLCAFYAVTYFFWYYATTTEQYSSAIAQTLAIVYLYLIWQTQQQTTGGSADRLILWLALLCGLALAHMVTVAFIVPPLVLVILWQAPQMIRSLRLVSRAVLAAFLPLLSYSYVYWRGAAHPEWWGQGEWATPQAWFWAFVSTAQGREELGWGLNPTCTVFANGFPALIWQELSLPLLLLGLVGVAWVGRRQATLLYGTCAIYLLFCWAYRCGNWFQVILPIYPIVLVGVAALVQRLRQQKRWGVSLYRISLACLLLAVVWRFVDSWPAADSRNRPEDSAFDRAALLLARPLPQRASLFAAVDDALALQYLVAIWQARPDLQVVNSRDASQLLSAGTPVYSTWEVAPTLRAELPADLAPTQQVLDADWIAFYPAPPAPQLPTTLLEQSLIPDVILQGYTITTTPPSPLQTYRPAIAVATEGVDLTLFWQAPKGVWPEGVSISVRPLQGHEALPDGKGGYLQQDRQRPTTALYHLSAATEASFVDAYHFALPATLIDQVEQIQLLLYRTTAAGFENLAEITLPVMIQ
ncbi:MAG: DUF2723 domain-containing protein [Caldilineaceae bacterium]